MHTTKEYLVKQDVASSITQKKVVYTKQSKAKQSKMELQNQRDPKSSVRQQSTVCTANDKRKVRQDGPKEQQDTQNELKILTRGAMQTATISSKANASSSLVLQQCSPGPQL